jgi:predicted O-methyltransferase YrrM
MYWKAAALSHTMTNSRREDWGHTLEAQRREVRTVLELGSYGGQSALFGASVTCTCIDYWQNFAEGCSLASEVKRHFDANLRGRAHKIKEDSPRALYSLQNSHAMFDLIYIDGDHSAHQVMVDSILAWRRLRPGGIMIWDDHREWGERPSTCFAGADIEVPPAAQ